MQIGTERIIQKMLENQNTKGYGSRWHKMDSFDRVFLGSCLLIVAICMLVNLGVKRFSKQYAKNKKIALAIEYDDHLRHFYVVHNVGWGYGNINVYLDNIHTDRRLSTKWQTRADIDYYKKVFPIGSVVYAHGHAQEIADIIFIMTPDKKIYTFDGVERSEITDVLFKLGAKKDENEIT